MQVAVCDGLYFNEKNGWIYNSLNVTSMFCSKIGVLTSGCFYKWSMYKTFEQTFFRSRLRWQSFTLYSILRTCATTRRGQIVAQQSRACEGCFSKTSTPRCYKGKESFRLWRPGWCIDGQLQPLQANSISRLNIRCQSTVRSRTVFLTMCKRVVGSD